MVLVMPRDSEDPYLRIPVHRVFFVAVVSEVLPLRRLAEGGVWLVALSLRAAGRLLQLPFNIASHTALPNREVATWRQRPLYSAQRPWFVPSRIQPVH